jgi:hypothetical protein
MICGVNGCDEHAVGRSNFCWAHLPDKDSFLKELLRSAAETACLKELNLKKVTLCGANLEKTDLSGANLAQADLSGAKLFDANLSGADLIGANLSSSDLTHTCLKSVFMMRCNLSGARLWNADLSGANLMEADLTSADLWNAKLYGVKLWRTLLGGAKSINMRSFSGGAAIAGSARIDESGELSAEEAYRDLKQYFLSNGMYKDASWASFKEKTLERAILRKKGDLHYLPSLLMGLVCGYGEKPHRIVFSAAGAIILFSIVYSLLGAIRYTLDAQYAMRWYDYLYYSTITFTTVGYGDFIPKPLALFRLIAACEAFTGVFLTGLFVFTLARKYSAR